MRPILSFSFFLKWFIAESMCWFSGHSYSNFFLSPPKVRKCGLHDFNSEQTRNEIKITLDFIGPEKSRSELLGSGFTFQRYGRLFRSFRESTGFRTLRQSFIRNLKEHFQTEKSSNSSRKSRSELFSDALSVVVSHVTDWILKKCRFFNRFWFLYLVFGGVKNPLPILLTALEGSTPRIFWRFWRIDMVQRIYRNKKEQSEMEV